MPIFSKAFGTRAFGAKSLGAMFAAGLVLGASPAPAQSQSGRVADEIARGVRDVAGAVITIRDAYDESVGGIRYGRQERFAIERCAPAAERYGRMRVQDVRRYERRSMRVTGTIGDQGRYRDSRYASRAFACTVRDDGRVKFKTKRMRY